MSAPVLPSDLLARIPSTTADKCTAFVNALIAFPRLVYQLVAWMFTTTGDVSDAFRTLVGFPPGTIVTTAASSTPTGFVECNGSAISRTAYASLFTAIGTAFGAGDGSSTFNVPDLRGRCPIGAGTGSGLSSRVLGDQTIGVETVTLAAENLPPHTHDLDVEYRPSAGSNANVLNSDTNPTGGPVDTLTTDDNTTDLRSVPVNNMQPSTVVRFIIKT